MPAARSEPLATLHPDHVTHQQLEDEFQRSGYEFNKRFETQYFIPLFTFVENGQACSIVDPLSANSYQRYRPKSDGIVFRPLNATINTTISLIIPSQRPLSNLAQAFNSMLEAELDSVRQSFVVN